MPYSRHLTKNPLYRAAESPTLHICFLMVVYWVGQDFASLLCMLIPASSVSISKHQEILYMAGSISPQWQ